MRVYLFSMAIGCLACCTTPSQAETLYVNRLSTAPTPPYAAWSTAATTIQDAIDSANTGDLILVTNGVYQTGGRVIYGALTNRVAITRAVTVQSLNGPTVTVIQGYQVPGVTNGDAAVRCVYMTNGAVLAGFTLEGGATRTSGDGIHEKIAGGVWCESTNAFLTNCVLVGCSGQTGVGGAYSGTLDSCLLETNFNFNLSAPPGGGAWLSRLHRCTLVGNQNYGAYKAVLNNCTIVANQGGTYGCTLDHCLICSNWAGGAWGGSLNDCAVLFNSNLLAGANTGGVGAASLTNCTLAGNVVSNASPGAAGGSYVCTFANSLIYYNRNLATNGLPDTSGGVAYYSCASNLHPVYGNITNAPLFIDLNAGNLRLQTNSPCVNAGINTSAVSTTDLDGRPRIVDGTVDMGAYEFQGSGISDFTAWLKQYGLPTDGSVDYVDTDGDGMNNWQEWICGTIPTNADSVLKMLFPISEGSANLILSWQSVTNRSYFVQRATDLAGQQSFLTVATNISGQPGTTTVTDTNTTGAAHSFYRVGVQ